jgi:hypothetical protein
MILDPEDEAFNEIERQAQATQGSGEKVYEFGGGETANPSFDTRPIYTSSY